MIIIVLFSLFVSPLSLRLYNTFLMFPEDYLTSKMFQNLNTKLGQIQFQADNSICRKSEIVHSNVLNGRSIIPKVLNSTDTTLLGVSSNMTHCLSLCCAVSKCNFAMLK